MKDQIKMDINIQKDEEEECNEYTSEQNRKFTRQRNGCSDKYPEKTNLHSYDDRQRGETNFRYAHARVHDICVRAGN